MSRTALRVLVPPTLHLCAPALGLGYVLCSGVVWRRLFGADAWPLWPKTPYAIPNLPWTDNWSRTHGDRLARYVTAAVESSTDVLGREHEQETRGARGD